MQEFNYQIQATKIFLTLTLSISTPAFGMKKIKEFIQAKQKTYQQKKLDAQLLESAQTGNLKALEQLFTLPNINIHATDKDGNTALHLAALEGKIEIISFLLKNGAQTNIKNTTEQTPLHTAAVPYCITSLISHGASINAQDKWGNTPLHYAVQATSNSRTETLINLGANVTIQNKLANTPLHLLRQPTDNYWDNVNYLAGLLLKAGARIDIKNKSGLTCDHTLEAIRAHIYTLLMQAIEAKNHTTTKRLLAQGADPNYEITNIDDNDTYTVMPLLHSAVLPDNGEGVRILLDAGANPTKEFIQYIMGAADAADIPRYRLAPVTKALKHGGPEMALLLLTHVSRKRIRDTWNKNALPFLVTCKRLPMIIKDIRNLLCFYFIGATLLDDQRTLAKEVCSQADPNGIPEEFIRHFDPECVDQYYALWNEQITLALKNRTLAIESAAQ